jgi:hypothetical protein
VTKLQARWSSNLDSIPGRGKFFSFLQHLGWLWGPHSLRPNRYRDLIPQRGIAPSVKVTVHLVLKLRMFGVIPPLINLCVTLLIKHKENFTFIFRLSHPKNVSSLYFVFSYLTTVKDRIWVPTSWKQAPEDMITIIYLKLCYANSIRCTTSIAQYVSSFWLLNLKDACSANICQHDTWTIIILSFYCEYIFVPCFWKFISLLKHNGCPVITKKKFSIQVFTVMSVQDCYTVGCDIV